MPTYILLMSLTDQGVRDIKGSPQRIEIACRALEAAGGRVLGFYAVMGPYDYVAVVEAPSDEAAMLQLLGLGRAGNVRTVTLKAWALEEFKDLVERLPQAP